jgi:hypothetical protein
VLEAVVEHHKRERHVIQVELVEMVEMVQLLL